MYNDKNAQSIIYQKAEDLWNVKWKEVKSLILPCLAPVEWSLEMNMVHTSFLDLSIYYYIRLENGKEKKTTWISHAEMRNWGIPMYELKAQAIRNMDNEGYSIHPIEKVIPVPKGKTYVPLYFLTNQTSVFGASGILKTDLIAEFAKEIGRSLHIIPSSIHELLFLPDNGLIDVEDLEQMIKEVNHTIVKPEDLLSNHTYYYNRATDEIQMEKQENES